MLKPTLILDCDGVLLNWADGFMAWCKRYKKLTPNDNYPSVYNVARWFDISQVAGNRLVEDFNGSRSFGKLNPMPTVAAGLERIKDAGFRTHVITCAGPAVVCQPLRRANLELHFPGMIDKLTCIPMSASKEAHLRVYDGSDYFFIEDHLMHAASALQFNVQPLLVHTPQNHGQRNPFQIPKFKTFEQAIAHVINNR